MEENAKPNRGYIHERDAQPQEVCVVLRVREKEKGSLARALNPGHSWKAGNTKAYLSCLESAL